MKYQPKWDLRSIPPAEIPDDLLVSWWQSYRARRPRKATADPKERKYLDSKAALMARLRAERKTGTVQSSPRRKKASA